MESAELLQNFQWGNDKTDKDNIKEELADVMTYCLYLCEYYDFDVKVIILDKINKNRKKYPIEKSLGNRTNIINFSKLS